MSALNPCPLCGGRKGYLLDTGSTFRWYAVNCADCGETLTACRASLPYNQPRPPRSDLADEAWQEVTKHHAAVMRALQEADTLMGHEDQYTEWRERWAHLWPAAAPAAKA